MPILDSETFYSEEDISKSLNLQKNLPRFTNVVRKRLFVLGKNSADRQMARAKSARNPLYRYDTGKMYRGFNVKKVSNTRIGLEFKREREVLSSLEKRYGIMTHASQSDLQNINDIVAEELQDNPTFINKFINGIKKIFKF